MKQSLKEKMAIESLFISNLRTSLLCLTFTLALKKYSKDKTTMIICNLLFLITFLLILTNTYTLYQINNYKKTIYIYHFINLIMIAIMIYSYTDIDK